MRSSATTRACSRTTPARPGFFPSSSGRIPTMGMAGWFWLFMRPSSAMRRGRSRYKNGWGDRRDRCPIAVYQSAGAGRTGTQGGGHRRSGFLRSPGTVSGGSRACPGPEGDPLRSPVPPTDFHPTTTSNQLKSRQGALQMKSWIPAVCMLILGIAVGFLIASRRPREIPMAFSNVGSLYVNPKSGDVIKWYNGSLPQNVQFKYDTSPCVELSASDKCTIKATKGDYFYKCVGAPDTCPDPGIRVGSAVIAEGQTTSSRTLPGPYADPKDPKLWCASGTAKGQPIAAKAGQSFEFDPVGDIEFTVTFAANTMQPRRFAHEQRSRLHHNAGGNVPPDLQDSH